MYEDLNCFEEALKLFNVKVETYVAMEMGGKITAEAAYEEIKEELKKVKKCRKFVRKTEYIDDEGDQGL